MTQDDTGQRRRTEDFKLNPQATDDMFPATERRRASSKARRRTPGRAFLRRFRQPIIGLSLAGAAAPLINAGPQQPADQPRTNEAQPTEADLARQTAEAATPAADVEDRLANKIAEAHDASKRASLVGEFVEKYDIDEGLAKDIYEIAKQEGIEPKLAYGLVKTESSFQNRAISHVGARGLTQVMPKTAKWMVPGLKTDDLYDQKTNLKLGFKYLNKMIDKYNGNVRLALLAYNRGPGTVDKILRRGGNPNNGYADKVLKG